MSKRPGAPLGPAKHKFPKIEEEIAANEQAIESLLSVLRQHTTDLEIKRGTAKELEQKQADEMDDLQGIFPVEIMDLLHAQLDDPTQFTRLNERARRRYGAYDLLEVGDPAWLLEMEKLMARRFDLSFRNRKTGERGFMHKLADSVLEHLRKNKAALTRGSNMSRSNRTHAIKLALLDTLETTFFWRFMVALGTRVARVDAMVKLATNPTTDYAWWPATMRYASEMDSDDDRVGPVLCGGADAPSRTRIYALTPDMAASKATHRPWGMPVCSVVEDTADGARNVFDVRYCDWQVPIYVEAEVLGMAAQSTPFGGTPSTRHLMAEHNVVQFPRPATFFHEDDEEDAAIALGVLHLGLDVDDQNILDFDHVTEASFTVELRKDRVVLASQTVPWAYNDVSAFVMDAALAEAGFVVMKEWLFVPIPRARAARAFNECRVTVTITNDEDIVQRRTLILQEDTNGKITQRLESEVTEVASLGQTHFHAQTNLSAFLDYLQADTNHRPRFVHASDTAALGSVLHRGRDRYLNPQTITSAARSILRHLYNTEDKGWESSLYEDIINEFVDDAYGFSMYNNYKEKEGTITITKMPKVVLYQCAACGDPDVAHVRADGSQAYCGDCASDDI